MRESDSARDSKAAERGCGRVLGEQGGLAEEFARGSQVDAGTLFGCHFWAPQLLVFYPPVRERTRRSAWAGRRASRHEGSIAALTDTVVAGPFLPPPGAEVEIDGILLSVFPPHPQAKLSRTYRAERSGNCVYCLCSFVWVLNSPFARARVTSRKELLGIAPMRGGCPPTRAHFEPSLRPSNVPARTWGAAKDKASNEMSRPVVYGSTTVSIQLTVLTVLSDCKGVYSY